MFTSEPFPFVYLAPGETARLKRSITQRYEYCGWHSTTIKFDREVAGYYTDKGEWKDVPVEQYSSQESYSIDVAQLPEVVEGAQGKECNGVTGSVEVEKAELAEGEALRVKFALRNNSQVKKTINSQVHSSVWYVLLSADNGTELAAEGTLLDKLHFSVMALLLRSESPPRASPVPSKSCI